MAKTHEMAASWAMPLRVMFLLLQIVGMRVRWMLQKSVETVETDTTYATLRATIVVVDTQSNVTRERNASIMVKSALPLPLDKVFD